MSVKKNSEKYNKISAFLIFPALVLFSLMILFSSCSNEKNIAATIGNRNIPFDEYRYFYMNSRADLEAAGNGYTEDELVDNTEGILLHNFAVYDLAKKNNVTLNADDNRYILSQIEEARASFSAESSNFEEALKRNYLTTEVYKSLLELNQLKYKLYTFMSDEYTGEIKSDDATVEADIQKNFIHASHIYLSKTEKNATLAEEILQKLANGEDFEKLKDEYSENTTENDSGNDKGEYYFTKGELIEEFEEAASALSEGEISGLVESAYGYHIIMRLPLEDDYIKENFEDLRYKYTVRAFNEIIESDYSTMEVNYTDDFLNRDKALLISGKSEITDTAAVTASN